MNTGFGYEIRKLRQARKIGIKVLAKAVDVDHSYISKIERNKVVPSLQLIQKIARHFGANPNSLLVAAGKLPPDIQKLFYTYPKEVTTILRESFSEYGLKGQESAQTVNKVDAKTGEEGNLFDQLSGQFGSVLIDPPWRFMNNTGKVAPEHKRLRRYNTMKFEEIAALPIDKLTLPQSHVYLWCPNALLPEALNIMKAWGFTYKTNVVWYKVRKDGGPDGRGVGFYFRNVTELILLGVKGKLRTLAPGRSQVNMLISRKQEHSRKPDSVYDLIERCSPGPYLELFARKRVRGWKQWGNEVDTYEKTRTIYKGYNGSASADILPIATLWDSEK